jgi:hypothetical protein
MLRIKKKLSIIDNDVLLGFTFDLDTPTDKIGGEALTDKAVERDYDRMFPNDNDSVSTFERSGDIGGSATPVKAHFRVRKLHQPYHDATSIASGASTVIMETFQSLEAKFNVLTSKVKDTHRKFDAIMDTLVGMKRQEIESSSSEKDGTSFTGTTKAGGENNSSSSRVP